MRIEIFIIKTEIEAIQEPHFEHLARRQLKKAKHALIELFNGLTVINNIKGYWKNHKGNIETDIGEIWLIYVNKPNPNQHEALINILKDIKQATKQQWQAYGINNNIHYI